MAETNDAYSLRDQLLKEKELKDNNMTAAYANQLYGTNTDAATVGASSTAADSDYSNYLAAQNQQLDVAGSTPTTKAPQTGVHLVGGGMTGQAQTAEAPNKDAMLAEQKTATQPAATTAAAASPVDYSSLSQYDQKLNDDSKNQILEQKKLYAEAQARGDTAAMQEAFLQAQLIRAKSGGYISDASDGSGYASFGYGNLSLADRQLSPEDQDEVLYWKLQYKYAKSPEEQKFAETMANKVREKSGYTSTNGSDYKELGPLDTQYEYTGGDFVDPYASQTADVSAYLSADQGWNPASYDPATDAAYQAYANYYGRNGQAAANSALAQAAGNTGGIANSYAQALAAAAQQSYAKQLTDVIPTLQSNAQKAYNDNIANKQALLNQYANMSSNAYNQYNTNRNFDLNAYNQNWQNAFNMYQLANQNAQNEADREWQSYWNQQNIDTDKYLATL